MKIIYNQSMSFRYLVIEDAAFIRELIKGVCRSAGGVCVGESEGGTSAVELVKQTLPDVVFLDLVLPGKNGVQLAGEIRTSWPEARLIACTSLDDSLIHQQALENGIDEIMMKPFTREKLIQTLDHQLSKRKEVAT